MSYLCRDVCRQIDEFAPPRFALEGDPVGLHLGNYDQKVDRLFMALELTPPILLEALDFRPDMLFVHHTPFFTPFKQLSDNDGRNRILLELIRKKMALYTAHTNLDSVGGGVNDVLADLLGLSQAEVLQPNSPSSADVGLGRIGVLDAPTTLDAFARETARKLGAAGVRYSGDGEQRVYRVACCGGAGAFLMTEAKSRGADTFVTSDVKHHEGILAMEAGIALVDAGHFHTENPAIPALAAYLQEKLPALTIAVSKLSSNPFTFV